MFDADLVFSTTAHFSAKPRSSPSQCVGGSNLRVSSSCLTTIEFDAKRSSRPSLSPQAGPNLRFSVTDQFDAKPERGTRALCTGPNLHVSTRSA